MDTDKYTFFRVTIACSTTAQPKVKAPGLLERFRRSLPWSRRPLTPEEIWAIKALD